MNKYKFRLDMPRKTGLILACIWLCIIVLGMSISVAMKLRQMDSAFRNDSMALYELVRQRLDQNESVLAGLDALFTTFPNLNFNGVRGYAAEMLKRYPHLYTVGLQPRVEFKDVAAFERQANIDLRPNYQIRDFELDGERVWRKAAVREFYYPVTFMEPPISDASPVMGLDVYADPKMRQAINGSINSHQMLSSAPFTLVEGGRGYVLFKALFEIDHSASSAAKTISRPTRLISLLINGSKLIKPDEYRNNSLSITIFHQGIGSSDLNGQLLNHSLRENSSLISRLFPHFIFERPFDSRSQPFILKVDQAVSWAIFSPSMVLGTLAAATFFILLIALIYSLRLQNHRDKSTADERLNQEQKRAVVTLSAITDGVIRFDTNAQVEFINTAAATLLHIDANARQLIDQVCPIEHELSKQAIKHPVYLALESGKSIELPENTLIATRSGDPFIAEGSVSPLFDSEHVLTGGVLIFRDMGPIQRRAKALIHASEQRLQEHQRELAHVSRLSTMGEMAAGLAHELNQPLTAILSYNQACTRLLSEDDPDLKEAIAAMRSASLQAKRAGEIITRLRAFVSKQTTELTGLDLRQVVSNSLVLIGPDLRANNIEMMCHLPDEMPLVMADSIQLEQVLMNLIRNAMDSLIDEKHTIRQISISISRINSSAIMIVQDTGNGITPEALEYLFHPFFTTKSTGMGLGLTICQSIVESFSGTLTVSNNAIGAKFICTLPIQKQPENFHA